MSLDNNISTRTTSDITHSNKPNNQINTITTTNNVVERSNTKYLTTKISRNYLKSELAVSKSGSNHHKPASKRHMKSGGNNSTSSGSNSISNSIVGNSVIGGGNSLASNTSQLNFAFVKAEVAEEGYVIYSIQAQDAQTGERWVFQTRYSLLNEMQRRLFQEVKALNPNFQTIKFPGKKWFFNQSRDFVEHRRAKLEGFM